MVPMVRGEKLSLLYHKARCLVLYITDLFSLMNVDEICNSADDSTLDSFDREVVITKL